MKIKTIILISIIIILSCYIGYDKFLDKDFAEVNVASIEGVDYVFDMLNETDKSGIMVIKGSFDDFYDNYDYKRYGDWDCKNSSVFLFNMAKEYDELPRLVVGKNNNGGNGHAWIRIRDKDRKGFNWIEYDSISKRKCYNYCISKEYDIVYVL